MLLRNSLRPTLVLMLSMTVLTGVVYPLLVTGFAQLLFPQQAAGSLLTQDGRLVGSALIGQSFTDSKYFWPRPSATASHAYNALASGGSNHGPLNPALIDAVKQRIAALKQADPDNTLPIPVDLVTASASGLDPHISIAAARYQLSRVARVRGMRPEQLQGLLATYTEGRALGFLGEPRVNVLQLNLALDKQ